MDSAQWPQDIVVKPMEEIVTNTCPKERKVRPQVSNCPRCNSTNTKFCYYNNYSLSQPRYFCKTCRRYWTEGGTLRSIPVGGGSRKNKRSTSNSSKNLVGIPPPQIPQNPNKIYDQNQDLNLGFSSITPHDFKTITDLIQVPNFDQNTNIKELQNNPSSSSSTSSHHISALELLNGITTSRGGLYISSFMPMPIIDPNTVYSSGFSIPEIKPSLNFSLDGLGSNYGKFQGVQETNGKLLFPYEDLNSKQVSSSTTTDHAEHNRDQIGDSTGYWNGMINGSGSW